MIMSKHSSSTSNFEERRKKQASAKSTVTFVIKLFVMLAVFLGFFYLILPQYAGTYNAGLIDKVNRLDSIDEAKIVLIGNSNLTCGMDSARLEEAFGMPVVNMGLNGSLGNAFHEEMAKMHVHAGDIYIMFHNDFNDTDDIPDPAAVWVTLENHLQLWTLIRGKDIYPMIKAAPTYFRKVLNHYTAGTGNLDRGVLGDWYSRSTFNEYGDVRMDMLPDHIFESEPVGVPGIGDKSINRLNALNAYLTERGATMLVAGYNIGNGYMTAGPDDFIAFQKQLQERLDCPVISNYVDYLFPYRLFSDSNLHLTAEGARIRTQQLITDLRNWMESGSEASFDADAYEEVLYDCRLAQIADFAEYMTTLFASEDRYLVFVSARDDASSGLNDRDVALLNDIGLQDLTTQGFRASYCAVKQPGAITEKVSMERIEQSGTFDEIPWTVISAGYDSGNESSVMIRNRELSYNLRGLNIVVYSVTRDRVIDCVNFDTYLPDKPVYR